MVQSLYIFIDFFMNADLSQWCAPSGAVVPLFERSWDQFPVSLAKKVKTGFHC